MSDRQVRYEASFRGNTPPDYMYAGLWQSTAAEARDMVFEGRGLRSAQGPREVYRDDTDTQAQRATTVRLNPHQFAWTGATASDTHGATRAPAMRYELGVATLHGNVDIAKVPPTRAREEDLGSMFSSRCYVTVGFPTGTYRPDMATSSANVHTELRDTEPSFVEGTMEFNTYQDARINVFGDPTSPRLVPSRVVAVHGIGMTSRKLEHNWGGVIYPDRTVMGQLEREFGARSLVNSIETIGVSAQPEDDAVASIIRNRDGDPEANPYAIAHASVTMGRIMQGVMPALQFIQDHRRS